MFLHKRITLPTMKGHHGASACTEAATWMLQAILGFCYGSRSQIRLLRSRLQRLKSSPCHAFKGIESPDLQRLIEERAPFEVVISPRRKLWQWRVCDRSGTVMMEGREKSRVGARYHSARALFLLLLTTRARDDTRPAPARTSPPRSSRRRRRVKGPSTTSSG
jgi:hypothetical protein